MIAGGFGSQLTLYDELSPDSRGTDQSLSPFLAHSQASSPGTSLHSPHPTSPENTMVGP